MSRPTPLFVALVVLIAACATSPADQPTPSANVTHSSSPSPEPTAAPTTGVPVALVAVLDVRCGDGAPVLGSDRVRTSRDGVRIHVVGEPGWHLGIGNESDHESVPLETADQELVLPVAPGEVRIDCADPMLVEPAPASAVRIEDPDGWYRPKAIGKVTGSCITGTASYGDDARGDSASPVEQVRKLLPGVQPSDVIERAGYATEEGWVRVVRGGEVVGVLEFVADGQGGWLLLSSTLCGSLSTG